MWSLPMFKPQRISSPSLILCIIFTPTASPKDPVEPVISMTFSVCKVAPNATKFVEDLVLLSTKMSQLIDENKRIVKH